MRAEEYKISSEKFVLHSAGEQLHDEKLETKPVSYLKDALIRFTRNKASIAAAFIIGILFLFAMIGPLVTPYEVAYEDANYAYVLPRNEFFYEKGIPFWDGGREIGVTEAAYNLYRGIQEETGRTVIMNEPEVRQEEYMGKPISYYDFRLDTYNAVGVKFVLLKYDEYVALQQYQDENNVQVIFPITDPALRPEAEQDKTNANILILGNSGQGKSYLLKLILTSLRESGIKVICLDPEHEYIDLTDNLGGCFVDLMSGEYMINVLEPKTWDENGSPEDTEAPYAFRCCSKLSQHISFLKDFFRTYKNFTDSQIDTIEIMLAKLYEKWDIRDDMDFSKLKPEDYPMLSDLYELMEEEYRHYDAKKKHLYTAELLQEICLGLHSMCKGAESKFFNGHTNITDSSFLTFGVKGLLQASRNVKDAMLFNILSYMSNELLTNGHTAASIDEFYLFLTNLTAVEYIRNFMKRVRKKESAVILASQKLEDFNIDGIREYTKPLFSIPTHAFLFNAGNIDAKFYIDTLQLEQSEYNLIRYPQRGVCLYKCGNECYNLMVHAPEYKEKLFGSAGGR